MSWHVAGSLEKLLGQLNTRAPRRSKASDGGIGDAEHRSRASDHNPWYNGNTVTARDYTHDPNGGLDGEWLANALVRSRDSRIKYLIWNRRICSGAGGPSPWVWRKYDGENPHTHHVHVSVIAAPACEDERPWRLDGDVPIPSGRRNLFKGMSGDDVTALQRLLTSTYPAYSKFPITGYFGPDTEAAVREFQRRSELTADGVVGPNTRAALGL